VLRTDSRHEARRSSGGTAGSGETLDGQQGRLLARPVQALGSGGAGSPRACQGDAVASLPGNGRAIALQDQYHESQRERGCDKKVIEVGGGHVLYATVTLPASTG